MIDFTREMRGVVKVNLVDRPSFSRLVTYELLGFCNFQSVIILLLILNELAHNNFYVTSISKRKKEVAVQINLASTNNLMILEILLFQTKTIH